LQIGKTPPCTPPPQDCLRPFFPKKTFVWVAPHFFFGHDGGKIGPKKRNTSSIRVTNNIEGGLKCFYHHFLMVIIAGFTQIMLWMIPTSATSQNWKNQIKNPFLWL
jgi:hypothetical protein